MPKQYSRPEQVIDPGKRYAATIRTDRGDIDIALDPSRAPQSVNNFVFLARDGFYDGLSFHRVGDGARGRGSRRVAVSASAPRLLAVHAHADDESITMGGTYAVLADGGVQLTNVCCTDGQLATIVDPTMDEASTRPRLGEVRRAELQQACAILGVGDVRFLGYHDSGMAGADTNNDAHAFFRCNTDEAGGRLGATLREG